MRNFFYSLVVLCAFTGLAIYSGLKANLISAAHYLGGLSLLAVMILFTTDHLMVYKRHLWRKTYAFISGALLIAVSAVLLLSGLIVFAYEEGEAPEVLSIHGLSAAFFIALFALHLLKSFKK